MFATRVRRFAVMCCLALAARPALAQGGSIGGKVTTEGGSPLSGVRVQAINANGQMAASVLSREDGSYRVANVAAGTYAVVATRIGYQLVRTEGVTVTAGGTATADFTMKEFATELNPVVTTASRRPRRRWPRRPRCRSSTCVTSRSAPP